MNARRLDPRTKLGAWFAATVSYFLLADGALRWTWLALLLALMTLCGGRAFGRFIVNLVMPTAFMLVVVYGCLMPTAEPSTSSLLGIKYSPTGVHEGLVIAARLAVLGGSMVAFIAMTPPMEFAAGLRALRVPPGVIAMLISSLGLLGVVEHRIRKIADAQRSRGLRPQGVIVGRLKVFIPVLRPLLFGLITDALERSALWESRHYLDAQGPGLPKLRRHDLAVILGALSMLLLGAVARWIL